VGALLLKKHLINHVVKQKKNVKKIVMDLKDQIRQQLKENKKSRGFGDTFEKFTRYTGIKRLVKWIYGEKDCGCDRRQDLWNKWFPYKSAPGCKEPCD
jgi:hypothetical protein